MTEQPSTVANIGVFGTTLILTTAMSQVILIFLARMLGPDDFGTYAVCIVFINILTNLSNFGLDAAAIQRQTDVDKAAQNAAAMRFVLSLVFALCLVLLAPFIADAVGNEDLVDPLRISGLAVVLSSLGFETLVRLHRGLRFRSVSMVRVANTIVWSASAMVLAYIGWGVWSLLIAYVLGLATAAVVLWTMKPWGVLYPIDRRIASELLRYGMFPMGTAMLAFLVWNVDKLAIGAVLGSSALLGAYYLAFTYGTVIPNMFTGATSTVMFPTFSKIQGDLESLKRRYLQALRYISYVSVPAGIGIAVVSETFVLGVLGPDWEPAVLPLAILSLVGVMTSLTSPASSVFLATGNPDRMFRQTWVMAVPFFVLLVPSIHYLELVGVALLFMGVALISFVWILLMVADILKFSMREELRMFVQPIVAGLVMAVPTLAVGMVLNPSVVALLVQVAVAMPVYFGCLYLLTKGAVLSEMKDILSSIRKR